MRLYAFLILVILAVAGCKAPAVEESQIQVDVGILVIPTRVVPGELFNVTWEVNVDEDYRTGVIYDRSLKEPDFYVYEFTTEIFAGDSFQSFTVSVEAFESGEMYLRPYVVSDGQLIYGEEISVPIQS